MSENQEQLDKLDNVVAIAISDGNWNANDYMRGMANGLLLAKHIMHDMKGEVPYFEPFTEDNKNE